MKFTWRNINRFLFVGGALLASMACVAPSVWLRLLNSANPLETNDSLLTAKPSSIQEKDSAEIRLLVLTQVEIDKAAAVPLHRMKPPSPVPPPPVAPVPIAVPVEAVLFNGSLVGIIQDDDPIFCYAVLKDPDGRIHLVARGGRLRERTDSPIVQSVNAESVVIAYGERTQVLKMGEETR
jgi:hypothetical protein